jgi:DNA repair protein RadC
MACSVIIAHNHPSGKLEPSDIDIKVTKKIKAALDLIDVKLLDHFIVTESGYYSFAAEEHL